MKIGFVLEQLNTNIYNRLISADTIKKFFDETANDYFFNKTHFAENSNRLENLIKKLFNLQEITDGENYTKVMSFFFDSRGNPTMKFDILYDMCMTYNVRLISMFDKDGERGSLTKPYETTKTLKGFISTDYLNAFNNLKIKKNYSNGLGKFERTHAVYDDSRLKNYYNNYLTIDNRGERAISLDSKHYTQNIRRICTIIFDLIVARAFLDIGLDIKKQILNEAETNIFDTKGDDYLKNEYILEIFFKKFLEFEQKRNDSISNLGLELYNTSIPKGTTSIPIKSICLFQEVNEHYKNKFEEHKNSSQYEIHIEPKDLFDSDNQIISHTFQITKEQKANSMKNSSSSVILCDSISEKSMLILNQRFCGFRDRDYKVKKQEKKINIPDIVFAKITIEGEKFLIVSVHTSSDGKSAIENLENILKMFKEDDSQHLIIGMDTNAKEETQREKLVNFCDNGKLLKIAGFPCPKDGYDYVNAKPDTCIPFLNETDINIDPIINFNLRYKQKIKKSYSTSTISRTFIQTQIHKGNQNSPDSNIKRKIYDFIFFQSKETSTSTSKLVSEEHQLNQILEVYDPMTPPFNYADHRPVKYRLKLIDKSGILKCYIDVTTFNMSGPNTNFFEYPLNVKNIIEDPGDSLDLDDDSSIEKFAEFKIQEYKKFSLIISQTIFNLESKFNENEKIEIKKGPIKTVESLIKKIKLANSESYEPYDILRYQIILKIDNFGNQLNTCIEFFEKHNFKLTNRGSQKNKFCVPNMYVGLNLIFQYNVGEVQNIYFEVQFHTCETYKHVKSSDIRSMYEEYRDLGATDTRKKEKAENEMLRRACKLEHNIKLVNAKIQKLLNTNPSWLVATGIDLNCNVIKGKECSNLKGGYRKTKRNRKYSQKRKKPLRNKKSKKSRNRKKYSRKK